MTEAMSTVERIRIFSTVHFLEQFLAKNRNHRYTVSHNESFEPDRTSRHRRCPAVRVAAGHITLWLGALSEDRGAEDFLGPGGRRNPLKTLNSDKEIQGNPRVFL
jgi:hypothetical protein